MFNKQTKLINSKYKKGNPYLCITQKIKLNPTTTVVKIIKHKNSNSYSSLNNLIKQDSKIPYDKKIRSLSSKKVINQILLLLKEIKVNLIQFI